MIEKLQLCPIVRNFHRIDPCQTRSDRLPSFLSKATRHAIRISGASVWTINWPMPRMRGKAAITEPGQSSFGHIRELNTPPAGREILLSHHGEALRKCKNQAVWLTSIFWRGPNASGLG